MCDPVTRAALPGLFQDLQADPEVRRRYNDALVPSMEPFGKLVEKANANGVIADDITGAAEIGAIGWRHGLRAEIVRGGKPGGHFAKAAKGELARAILLDGLAVIDTWHHPQFALTLLVGMRTDAVGSC